MDVIVNEINAMSGNYHPHEIFQDWVKMSAISINNSLSFNFKMEKQYLDLVNKYSSDNLKQMCKWLARLTELFEKNIDDYLGKIYMQLNAGSARMGQFFTPFHTCCLMAEISLVSYDGKKITINEPSVGAGGNILAIAKAINKKGYNYQALMDVVVQDLDYKCFWMSYLQLSLAGISAKCIQGNTLAKEENVILVTPMFILRGRT